MQERGFVPNICGLCPKAWLSERLCRVTASPLTQGSVLVAPHAGLQVLLADLLPLAVLMSSCLSGRLFPTLVFKYCTSTLLQRKTKTSSLKTFAHSRPPIQSIACRWHTSELERKTCTLRGCYLAMKPTS